jgi:transcriptional regulator GlxA family with amidase domain
MDVAGHDFEEIIQAHFAADRSPRARVRRVVQSILDDPGGAHEVAQLAQRAAMSARTLSRAFRRETGTSPARFVERARLALARALIERGASRMGFVAARAGFESAERMRRAFHRALGTSPSGLAQSTGSGTTRR